MATNPPSPALPQGAGSKKKSSSLPPKPYTSYTIFFRLERAHINQSSGIINEEVLASLDPSHHDPLEHPRPEKYRHLVLPPYWYSSSHSAALERKRKHRKRSGRVDMTTLSKTISARWRAVPADSDIGKYCHRLARAELGRYNEQVADGMKAAAAAPAEAATRAAIRAVTKEAVVPAVVPTAPPTAVAAGAGGGGRAALLAYGRMLLELKANAGLLPKGVVAEEAPAGGEGPAPAAATAGSGKRPREEEGGEGSPPPPPAKRAGAGTSDAAGAAKGEGPADAGGAADAVSSARLLRARVEAMGEFQRERARGRFATGETGHSFLRSVSMDRAAWLAAVDEASRRTSPRRGGTNGVVVDASAGATRGAAAGVGAKGYFSNGLLAGGLEEASLGMPFADMLSSRRVADALSSARARAESGLQTLQANRGGTDERGRSLWVPEVSPLVGTRPAVFADSAARRSMMLAPSPLAHRRESAGSDASAANENADASGVGKMPQPPVPPPNKSDPALAVVDVDEDSGSGDVRHISPPNVNEGNDPTPEEVTSATISDASTHDLPCQDEDPHKGAGASVDRRKRPKPTRPDHAVCLFIQSDDAVLDPVHKFPRCHCIELFEKRDGDSHPGPVGRVGLRCFYCKNAFFPASRACLYDVMWNFQHNHLDGCKGIPAKMKAAHQELVAKVGRGGGRPPLSHGFLRAYYAEAASEIGLVDRPDGGLAFGALPNESGVPSERLRALIDLATKGANAPNDDARDAPPAKDGGAREGVERDGVVPIAVTSNGASDERKRRGAESPKDARDHLRRSASLPTGRGAKLPGDVLPRPSGPDRPLRLAVPADDHVLDLAHAYPRRHCIEIFEKRHGHDVPGRVGQVGLRCSYCGTLCLPSKRAGLYDNVRDFQDKHLVACPALAPDVRERYLALALARGEGARHSTAFLRAYYAETAGEIGLVDSPHGGLEFADPRDGGGATSGRLRGLLESAGFLGLL